MRGVREKLLDVTANKYEAVLVAARMARKINSQRVAAKELLAPEEYGKIDNRKVTSVALEELLAGRVKYERRKKGEEKQETSFDLT